MSMNAANDGNAAIRFPARMAFRCPQDLPKAVEIIAERANTTPGEWARRALLAALEAEGIRLRSGKMEAAA